MMSLKIICHKILRTNFWCTSIALFLMTQSINAGEVTYTFSGSVNVHTSTGYSDPWELGYGTQGHTFSLSITMDDQPHTVVTDAYGTLITVQISHFIDGTMTIDGITSDVTSVILSVYDDWQTTEDYFRVIAETEFNGESDSVNLRITFDKDTFTFSDATATLPSLDFGAADLIKYISANGVSAYRYHTSEVQSDGFSQPPIADAGADQTVDCSGPDGANVLLDATASSDPDGDPLTYEWSVPSGVTLDNPASPTPSGTFPIGVTMATLTVTDGNGGLDTDDVMITVVDGTPPEVACTTSLAAIWPPNHDMVPILVSVQATDHCTAPEELVLGWVTIQSNEPDDADGLGDGETTGDVDGHDGFTDSVDVTNLLTYNSETASFEGIVFLRAERDGDGFGRTYSINATVLDTALNLAETSCVVIVPHDRRKQK